MKRNRGKKIDQKDVGWRKLNREGKNIFMITTRCTNNDLSLLLYFSSFLSFYFQPISNVIFHLVSQPNHHKMKPESTCCSKARFGKEEKKIVREERRMMVT